MVLGFTGCSSVQYLLHVSKGQWSLYNRERPIAEVLADAEVKTDIKERLRWIDEIKLMAERKLGIPSTKNYRTYVDLKRPYVIWSLTVAKKDMLEIQEFSFPIVGSFPYLGFFSEAYAHEWQKKYADLGFDTHVRGVTAYSMLGYLREPLLSSMITGEKASLVNLIFHESTHGVFYIKGPIGAGAVNEQVASFIGEYAEREYLLETFGVESVPYKKWFSGQRDRKRFGAALRSLADALRVAYQNERPRAEVFKQFEKRIPSYGFETEGYKRALSRVDNNAILLAYLTYEDNQDIFEKLYMKSGQNIKTALEHLLVFQEQFQHRQQGSNPEKNSPEKNSLMNALVQFIQKL